MKHITIKEWFCSVRRLGSMGYRVFRDMWPGNERLIIKLSVSTILTACLPFAIFWSYSRAIGSMSNIRSAPMALWYICGALTVAFVVSLIQTYFEYCDKSFCNRMINRLNILYIQHKGRLSIQQLENPEFRDVVSRSEEKGYWPAMNIALGQFMNLNNAIRIVAALTIIGAYDITLGVWILVSLIPQFVVDIRHGATLWGIFMAETDERRKYGELSRHLRQKSSLAELKMFQNVDYFVTRIREILQNFQDAQTKAERRKHLYSMITILLGTLVMSVVLVTITLRVINGATPLSVFVFIWSSTQSLHATLGGTLRSIAQQNEFALYAADMYAVRDATPEAVRRNDSIVCADRIPEIVFEHVAFQYPFDKKGREILQDISFKIRPGERLALVGCNAAGKTTIVRLICGIYEPTKGRILVDGVDLKEIDINSWRKQLSVLFQNYAQYNIIVREVIALGDTKCEPTDEHIAEAANQSGVDKFVADLPDGYKTQIGKDFKDGIEPSGGQNQRIALARVAYRQGKVVILDEPTASLDAFAEAEIFEELEHHSGRSTLILITHRFSTIKIADHIVVLDHGKIIEEGSHTSLMRNNGLYADMYLKQARGYMDQPIDIDKEEG